MKKLATLLLLSLFTIISFAQNNGQLVPGFQKELSGEPWTYDSSIPILNKSILVRATDESYIMSWETAPVPKTKESHISFVWFAGLGAGSGEKDFYLYMNDEKILTFKTTDRKTWTEKGINDIELTFNKDGQDPHGDIFGYMFLKVPADQLKKGESVELKITGSESSSQAWVMTFTNSLEEKLVVKQSPARLKNQENQVIHASCLGW